MPEPSAACFALLSSEAPLMTKLKARFPRKTDSHNILIKNILRSYEADKDSEINMAELARLADIPYRRLSRLMLDDGVWTVEEWFRVIVVADASLAIEAMFSTTQRHLIAYQKTARYFKKLPRWHPDSRKEEHESTRLGKRRASKRKKMYRNAQERKLKESKDKS